MPQDKVQLGSRHPPGLPKKWRLRRLSTQILEAQAGKWSQRASMLQGISLKKRVRARKKGRKKDTEEPGFLGTDPGPSLYFSGKLLYLDLYIEGNERCKVIQSQPKHYICFVFIKTRIFSAYLSHKQCCVHYLLALEACEHFMALFWSRLLNQKTYFPLKCFFFIFLTYVSLRKY